MSAVQTLTAPVSLQPDSAHRHQLVLLGNSEARQANNSLDDPPSCLHRMVSHYHVSHLDILVGNSPAQSEIFQELRQIVASAERADYDNVTNRESWFHRTSITNTVEV